VSLLKDSKQKKRLLHNEPIAKHTTFRIGGPAKIWAEPQDFTDLKKLLEFSKSQGMGIFVIGGGTNILVSDEGLKSIALSLKKAFGYIKITDEKIVCGSGTNLQSFVLHTIENGYCGLEFMAGIPGSIGGAVVKNAGSGLEGPWISDFIHRVRVLDPDGAIRSIAKEDINFSYRSSGLEDSIVLEVEFILKKAEAKSDAIREYQDYLNEKKSKQDLSSLSAGCVFKNPEGSEMSAASLIEKCDLKGKRVGDAVISEKHANFILNLGKASFADVVKLIELAKKTVKDKYKVELETELEIIR